MSTPTERIENVFGKRRDSFSPLDQEIFKQLDAFNLRLIYLENRVIPCEHIDWKFLSAKERTSYFGTSAKVCDKCKVIFI